MRYLIRHVKCMRYLICHVKCMRYLIRHVKCMRYLIRHVKCMRYLTHSYLISPWKMYALLNSPCKKESYDIGLLFDKIYLLLIFFSFVHLCKLLLLACNFSIIFDLVFLNVGLLDLTSFCDVCVGKKNVNAD